MSRRGGYGGLGYIVIARDDVPGVAVPTSRTGYGRTHGRTAGTLLPVRFYYEPHTVDRGKRGRRGTRARPARVPYGYARRTRHCGHRYTVQPWWVVRKH